MTTALVAPVTSRRALAWLVALALAGVYAASFTALPRVAFTALPLAVLMAFVVLRWPWMALLLLVASVPVQQLGAAAGGRFTATRLALPVVLGALAISLLVRRDAFVSHRLVLPFVVLIAVMATSVLVADDTGAALAATARWAIAGMAFAVGVHVLADSPAWRLIALVATIAVAGVLEATVGVIQSILVAGPESFAVTDAFSRGYGTFGRPNTFAGFLEISFFPSLWLAAHQLRESGQYLTHYRRARLAGVAASTAERRNLYLSIALAAGFAGASLAILAGIGTSFSRGAWLGTAAGLAVTLWLWQRWARVLMLLGGIGLVAAAVGGNTQLVPGAVSARLGSIVDEVRPFDASSAIITDESFSTVERMAHWQAGWEMFRAHPALGVGIGNFDARYDDYYVREEFRFSRGHAHNFYINQLAETGILGLSVYLTLVGSVALLALRVVLDAPAGLERALALGTLGSVTAVGVHNLFENLHVLNMGITMSVIWCLTIAAHRRMRAVDRAENVEYSR